MGYHVKIVRTVSGQARPITRDELERALGAMQGRLVFDAGQSSGTQLYEPAKGDASEILIFDSGELWASTPSDPFLSLMIELADLLGARVRGDELETYRTLDDVYQHPDDAALRRDAGPAPARPRSAWDEWKGRLTVVGIGVLLGSGFIAWKHLTST